MGFDDFQIAHMARSASEDDELIDVVLGMPKKVFVKGFYIELPEKIEPNQFDLADLEDDLKFALACNGIAFEKAIPVLEEE